MIQTFLKNLNIPALKPMQEAAIDAAKKNNNLILLSPTGSGKTLAFLIPIAERLKKEQKNVQVLVLAPSRELALQIEQVFRSMNTGFKVNCCYGGHLMKTERKNLSEPPALLIGTPGRILDHLKRETFSPDNIHTLVLDEFDKSLDLGFQDEMADIISRLPSVKKRILTSATRAQEIPEFTGITNPVVLDFLSEEEAIPELTLHVVKSDDRDKLYTLFRLLCYLRGESTLVFLNHRDAAQRVSDYLNENQIPNAYFHGGLEQHIRERALTKFRNGSCNLLVCTDLASRGLDIPEIKHIIHYHLPLNEEAFTHRNGRTARMHAKGNSYIILNGEETLPPFIRQETFALNLPEEDILPPNPQWETLYIGKGKKDKISKIDIVGFLTQKGQLKKEEIGLIEVKDFNAFVAVKRGKMKNLLKLIQNEKIKGMKTKMDSSE